MIMGIGGWEREEMIYWVKVVYKQCFCIMVLEIGL